MPSPCTVCVCEQVEEELQSLKESLLVKNDELQLFSDRLEQEKARAEIEHKTISHFEFWSLMKDSFKGDYLGLRGNSRLLRMVREGLSACRRECG